MTTNVLVCSAGAIGSTELLMQCKYVHRTLPALPAPLGTGYHTNGDFVTFLVPKRGLLLSWCGLFAAVVGLIMWQWPVMLSSALLYLWGWFRSGKKADPDKGSTNSDYIRFKHRDGSTQGVYIEGGRYPTPLKAIAAIVYSLTGKYRPESYGKISGVVDRLARYVPVIELLERSWPIPILLMGRDDAVGTFSLNEKGEAEIDYPFEHNKDYLAHLNALGKLFAETSESFYIANRIAQGFKIVEVPHNIGGVPMGNNSTDGVVDTFGRVFGHENLVVLDGSILPNSLGPNPVDTILALSERAMSTVVAQLNATGRITAEEYAS